MIGVISPWNYPWSIPLGRGRAGADGRQRRRAQARFADAADRRADRRAFERAGVPEGLVRVVHGPGTGAGARELERRQGVLHRVGRGRSRRGRGMRAPAEGLGARARRQGPDDRARRTRTSSTRLPGALWGGFANAGQTCSGIERVYVMREVSERFISGVVAGAQRCGSATRWSWDTEIGPMVSREQFELVSRARRRRRRRGRDDPLRRPGRRRPPGSSRRVLRADRPDRRHPRDADHARGDLRAGAADHRRRLRGRGGGARQRLRLRPRGLVWTSDRSKGERIARELEAGMVWINDHMFSHGACQCSWGGVKDSGLGRTHSKFGLYECVNVKLRVWEPARRSATLVASVRRDARQGAATDRRDPLRPPVDPRAGAARRRSAAAEARRAARARRAQALGAARRALAPRQRDSRRTWIRPPSEDKRPQYP